MGRGGWTKRTPQRLSAAALSLTLAQPATAEERAGDPVRYSVRYDAPEGCPSEEELRRGIQTRTVRAEPADEASADVRLEITLIRAGEHTTGELVATASDGARTERRVGDTSCDAAVSSLAVMSALMLDAHLGGPAPPAAAPVPAPDAAPPARARSSAGSRRPPPPPLRPVTHSRSRANVRLRARAHALWESAAAPGVPLGALAGVELRWRRHGVLAPALAASMLAAFSQRTSTSAGAARFRLVAVRVSSCSIALPLPLDAQARLCAEVDAGALRGKPDAAVLNPRARAMPWLAVGLAARAELPLTGGLSLELGGGGRALARHDRFFFRPGVPVHDVPPWSAGGSLGLSYGF